MKSTLLPITAILLAALCSGCRETEIDTARPLPACREETKMVRVRVGFTQNGQADTKSVATEAVESFTEAYLFAFWASGADAGKPCIVNGRPVAVYTGSKTFDWSVPAGVPIEVIAFVNAVEDVRRELDNWAFGLSSFTKDNLLSFRYSCASASDLRDLQDREYNMPMTGMTTVTVDPDAPSLSIPVKRLFAKFSLTLDVSAWADDGWSVTAASVTGARSNTEVPYFYTGSGDGFTQTDPAKFGTVDTSTSGDLVRLNFRDRDNCSMPVTFYFLENCQDVSESASRWSAVAQELGEKIANCSYMKINVRATKAGFGERTFGYRIYLDSAEGSEMNTGFNIIRNTSRSITLKMGAPQDSFLWTNTSPVITEPGESFTIPFETSLKAEELVFVPASATIGYVSAMADPSTGCGSAEFKASYSAEDGIYTIRGGNGSGDVSDVVSVEVRTPFEIEAIVSSGNYAFSRFNVTLKSESMNGWSAEKRNRLENVFQGLALRSGSPDLHFIGSPSLSHISVSGTNDVLVKRFTVLSTSNRPVSIEAFDQSTGIVYKTLDINILTPIIVFVSQNTGLFIDNDFTGFDTDGDDGPVYQTSFTGGTAYGFFWFKDENGTTLNILAEDLALGSLSISQIEGCTFSVKTTPNSARAFSFSGSLDTWAHLGGLKSNVNYSGPADECTFWKEYISPGIELRSESGRLICSEPVHFEVTNPFREWFSGSSRPNSYTVVLDGSTNNQDIGDISYDWPASASFQPSIIETGNVTTSKAGSSACSLVWEHHSNEVESVKVADDLHNYGCIKIGGTVTHTKSGESLTMLWGKVDVWREFTVYAGYQFSQAKYLANDSTPYTGGTLSRFIPYIFAPNIGLTGVSLRDMVKTTASAQTGINAVNPTEDFYAETCRTEHWWPEHYGKSGYDSTNSTLWDCEFATSERECLTVNSVVVYPSPKTVTSNGELSYYELRYAGPQVSSHISFYLGHHGHHSDDIYSFRSVAYWNQPAFEFHTGNIGSSASVKSFSSGEKYLQIGDYTRVRFYWRKRGLIESHARINSHDTRYPMKQSWYTYVYTSSFKDTGYFGDTTASLSADYTTPYFDPRRSTLEQLKLYVVKIPFFRKQGNIVKAADGGSFTGTYEDEDIVNTHEFGHAIGKEDSFWLSGNLLP